MNEYPKRGGDCEYTMDCPWGVDGWCDRPAGNKCEIQKMDEEKAESDRGCEHCRGWDNRCGANYCPMCGRKLEVRK